MKVEVQLKKIKHKNCISRETDIGQAMLTCNNICTYQELYWWSHCAGTDKINAQYLHILLFWNSGTLIQITREFLISFISRHKMSNKYACIHRIHFCNSSTGK